MRYRAAHYTGMYCLFMSRAAVVRKPSFKFSCIFCIANSKLLNLYWQNIDPFDVAGQFCDKGLSYRSVVFYENDFQKKLIKKSIKKIEKKFNNKKIVTFVRKFDKFYKAENQHKNYYQENFLNYLIYKKACART